MLWTDIFEPWPKRSSFVPGVGKIREKLPLDGDEDINDIPYVRWNDNRCRKIKENGDIGCYVLVNDTYNCDEYS